MKRSSRARASTPNGGHRHITQIDCGGRPPAACSSDRRSTRRRSIASSISTSATCSPHARQRIVKATSAIELTTGRQLSLKLGEAPAERPGEDAGPDAGQPDISGAERDRNAVQKDSALSTRPAGLNRPALLESPSACARRSPGAPLHLPGHRGPRTAAAEPPVSRKDWAPMSFLPQRGAGGDLGRCHSAERAGQARQFGTREQEIAILMLHGLLHLWHGPCARPRPHARAEAGCKTWLGAGLIERVRGDAAAGCRRRRAHLVLASHLRATAVLESMPAARANCRAEFFRDTLEDASGSKRARHAGFSLQALLAAFARPGDVRHLGGAGGVLLDGVGGSRVFAWATMLVAAYVVPKWFTAKPVRGGCCRCFRCSAADLAVRPLTSVLAFLQSLSDLNEQPGEGIRRLRPRRTSKR